MSRPTLRTVLVVERLAWLAAVLAATWCVGTGLEKAFYIENTTEAVREAEAGMRLVGLGSAALLALAGYAWWRGAPRWAWVLVLAVPVVSGGLAGLSSESLLPQLSFLLAGPLTVLAAVVGAVVRWRARRPQHAAAGAVGGSS